MAAASSTGLPAMRSVTSRTLRGLMRMYLAVALTRIGRLLLQRRAAFGGPAMTAVVAGRGELPQAMADHVLGDEDRHVPPPAGAGEGVPDHLREDHAGAGPGLRHRPLVLAVHLVDAAEKARLDERSLLERATHRVLLTSSKPTADDQLAGGVLALARAQPHGRLAPWRLGRHADRRLALATAVRVVVGVHHHAAHLRAAAHVAAASGLADVLVLVIQVAHLSDRGHALGAHPAHLAGG